MSTIFGQQTRVQTNIEASNKIKLTSGRRHHERDRLLRGTSPRASDGSSAARPTDTMPFCALNAAFVVAGATFVGGAVVAAKSGADADSALGKWRRAREAKEEAEAVRARRRDAIEGVVG